MLKRAYMKNGKVWEVQPSFFLGCIDLVSDNETIAIAYTASDKEIFQVLEEHDRQNPQEVKAA